MSEGTITHVAGSYVSYGADATRVVRQRCAWCGALIYEASMTVFPGMELAAKPFILFSLVRVDGSYSEQIDFIEANGSIHLPPDSCMNLDPAITT